MCISTCHILHVRHIFNDILDKLVRTVREKERGREGGEERAVRTRLERGRKDGT